MGKCTKCGTNFIGTPEQPPSDGLCHYCERDQLKADNAKLRKALVGLVDADGKEELDMMEMHLLDMPDPEESNRKVALIAIKALRETLPCKPPIVTQLNPSPEERERMLRAALIEFVRVESNFGHTGQHKPEECADCKRVLQAHEALGHGYLK